MKKENIYLLNDANYNHILYFGINSITNNSNNNNNNNYHIFRYNKNRNNKHKNKNTPNNPSDDEYLHEINAPVLNSIRIYIATDNETFEMKREKLLANFFKHGVNSQIDNNNNFNTKMTPNNGILNALHSSDDSDDSVGSGHRVGLSVDSDDIDFFMQLNDFNPKKRDNN